MKENVKKAAELEGVDEDCSGEHREYVKMLVTAEVVHKGLLNVRANILDVIGLAEEITDQVLSD